MADRVPVSTKDNSIIMPDVPNFTERHFQHFQRSAGHTSTGETLLYEATLDLPKLAGAGTNEYADKEHSFYSYDVV